MGSSVVFVVRWACGRRAMASAAGPMGCFCGCSSSSCLASSPGATCSQEERKALRNIARTLDSMSLWRWSWVFLSLATMLASTERASAGDFWDEVREPGISAFRAHVRRAQAAIGARRFELARRASEVAIGLLPNRAEGHAAHGIALAERNRPTEAADAVARALALDSGAYDDPLFGSRAVRRDP